MTGENSRRHRERHTWAGLTHPAVAKLKPGLKRIERPDRGPNAVAGLYLIIQPTGQKSWALRYRSGGKTWKLSLGKFPDFGLADARKRALAEQSAIKNDNANPAGKKQAAKLPSNSFGARFETFIHDHVSTLSASSQRENRRMWEIELKPLCAQRPLTEISKQEIRDLLSAIKARGAPYTSNRVHSLLSRFFNWCIAQDLIEKNPMLGVKKIHKERQRTRTLNDEELRVLWNIAGETPYPLGPFVQLSLMTVQRPTDDISQMQWSDINLVKADWTVRGEQTKNGRPHSIPLSPQAVALLKKLPRMTGPDGKASPWVFTLDGKVPSGPTSKRAIALREKLYSAGAMPSPNLPEHEREWNWHDFRRTGYQLLQRLGVTKDVTRHIANHKTGKDVNPIDHVYGVYEFADEKRSALNALANKIDRIARGKDFVPLQAAS